MKSDVGILNCLAKGFGAGFYHYSASSLRIINFPLTRLHKIKYIMCL